MIKLPISSGRNNMSFQGKWKESHVSFIFTANDLENNKNDHQKNCVFFVLNQQCEYYHICLSVCHSIHSIDRLHFLLVKILKLLFSLVKISKLLFPLVKISKLLFQLVKKSKLLFSLVESAVLLLAVYKLILW